MKFRITREEFMKHWEIKIPEVLELEGEPVEEECEHGYTEDTLYCVLCGKSRVTETSQPPQPIEELDLNVIHDEKNLADLLLAQKINEVIKAINKK